MPTAQGYISDVEIYFTDFFGIDPALLEKYGAFNISLINDLPLFVDPFLLFNSKKHEYRELHDEMIHYLRFLRDKAAGDELGRGLLDAWFTFHEIKQNWLGFSRTGNTGSGLGIDFAQALCKNLNSIFKTFGAETVTAGSHIEKLTLIRSGVGRDNISDFTTNLIKGYLLRYTQRFAQDHIKPELRSTFSVSKVRFNYQTETWESGSIEMPCYRGDFVLLTPKDILTKDDTWISRPDLLERFEVIADSMPNDSLRALINNYFLRILPKNAKEKEIAQAKAETVEKFPEIIEYYIKEKEDNGAEAQSVSKKKVRQTESFFIDQVKALVRVLFDNTEFYDYVGNTYEEARQRLDFLKDVIENKDGYRFFWRNGTPIRTEEDLQILYRLTWFGTPSDVNREVNNGRGPVDFKISRGSSDRALVEWKLASNRKLKRNLENQISIYEKASDANRALKAIIYFTETEFIRVQNILKELKLLNSKDILLIDARRDNKPSASVA